MNDGKNMFYKPFIGTGYLIIGMIELIVTPLGWLQIFSSLLYLLSIKMLRNKYNMGDLQRFYISDYKRKKEWGILLIEEAIMFNLALFILIKPVRFLMLISLGISVWALCVAVMDLFGEK